MEKATVGKEADKMDPVQLGHHTQAATASITAEQSVYAVLTLDNFMLLRTENDYSISVLQQIESANDSLFKEQVRRYALLALREQSVTFMLSSHHHNAT